MNRLIRLIPLYFFWMPQIIFGQSFQNLDFDSAIVSPPDDFGRIPLANALPGWSSGIPLAYYNRADLDQMTIGVYDQSGSLCSWGPHPIFESSGYTAYLEADLGSLLSGSVGIWQTGVIPVDGKSIQFYSTIAYGSALPGYNPTLTLSLNGTPVSISPIGTFGAFTQYTADVSAFAGTSTSLKFEVSATYPYPHGVPNPHWIFGVGIDDISFSATPAPEPATITLFGVGLLPFIFKLSRKSNC
jgi:hypothetical protein